MAGNKGTTGVYCLTLFVYGHFFFASWHNEMNDPWNHILKPTGSPVGNRLYKADVKDTELWLAISMLENVSLVSKIWDIVQHWDHISVITGGALALEKFFYVALEATPQSCKHSVSPSSNMHRHTLGYIQQTY